MIDHIAHRSLDWTPLLEKYKQQGYQVQSDRYDFPRLGVVGTWLRHPLPCHAVPRIFLSEYRGEKYAERRITSRKDHDALHQQNQYVAWTLLHGDAINHVALRVDNVRALYSDLVRDPNVAMATEVQTSENGKLLQCSLKADKVWHRFPNGERTQVPGSFVELIERHGEGFDTHNADRIFESTI